MSIPQPKTARPRVRLTCALSCLASACVLLVQPAAAQVADPATSHDDAAVATNDRRPAEQIADSAAIAAHARALTAQATTETERAAALYEWVARNVAYDAPAAVAGRHSHESAEAVWRHRLATCGGFVALYARLAGEAGLVVETLEGYAKGFDYRHGQSTRKPNHAWLAVRVDGRWGLVDPTWAAGTVAGGAFHPAFSWAYFLADPDALVLSHFPESSRWQLVQRPLSRREFERMPAVPRALLDIGFTPDVLRATALSSSAASFPTVTSTAGARVLRAPAAGVLRTAAPLEVEVHWPGATEMAVIAGDVWTPLHRDGDTFRGAARAGGETVWVVGRQGGEYTTVLHYRVH